MHGFGYSPSFSNVVKGKEVQECHDTPVLILEWGSLNYGGDHVLVGCVKDFKTLPNIHNVCLSEGFSKEEENDDEMILSSFQSIVNEYNVMENSPDGVEKSPRKMENSLDHVENYDVYVDNSPEISPKQLENSHVHVENSHVHVENSLEQMENSSVHVENSYAHMENSPGLSRDPFRNEVVVNVAHEGISSLGIVKSVPKNMSPTGSKHDHVDSLAPSSKPVNGFSILERFKEFISIGQAMVFGLSEKEKKQWVKMLCHSNQVNFLSLQETKMVSFDIFKVTRSGDQRESGRGGQGNGRGSQGGGRGGQGSSQGSQGGGRDGQESDQGSQGSSRCNRVNGGGGGVPDFATIIAQQLQNLLPTIVEK
ncbi:hypothetical protein Tco_1110429 [Tanacetum coccineum]|uniref:Uncharacterized protein n=1 Tax=Tanacetum coccineum TaxID=301880 RepID=A0ABQ5IJ89_9ASTR